MKILAVLFARVSTEDQTRGFSIDAQVAEMRAYCERLGWMIVAIFIEPGTSVFTSKLDAIPELREAIAWVESGKAQVLVIHESSRLARNERLGQEIMDRLEACGARLVNVSTSMDYHTPEGRLAYTFETGVNAFTSRKIAQHSQKGKREQFRQGLQVGQIPYGYIKSESRKLPAQLVPDEAEIVRGLFQDAATGRSIYDIARDLNRRGVSLRTGRSGRWIPQTIASMLRNRFYLGEVEHLGDHVPGQHLPLVDDDLFAAAQHPRQRQSRKKYFPPLLLQGVAICSSCRGRVYPFRPRKNRRSPEERYRYYREPSSQFCRPCEQASGLWPADDADRVVDATVRALVMDVAWLAHVDREAARPTNSDASKERDNLTRKRSRTVRAWIEGELEDDDYREILRGIDDRLAFLPAATNRIALLKDRLTRFADLWDRATPEFQNEVCQILFQFVELDFGARMVRLCPWPEFEPLFDLRVSYVGTTQRGRGSR